MACRASAGAVFEGVRVFCLCCLRKAGLSLRAALYPVTVYMLTYTSYLQRDAAPPGIAPAPCSPCQSISEQVSMRTVGATLNESEQRPPALFGSSVLPTTRPPWLPLPQTGEPVRRVRTDRLECSLLLNLFCIGRRGSREPAGSRSDAEVEPPAHQVVHSAAPPPPPQWEPVGSIEPMQRLQDFEGHLRLPPEAEGHSTPKEGLPI